MDTLVQALRDLSLDKKAADMMIIQIQNQIGEKQESLKTVTDPEIVEAINEEIDELSEKAQPFIEVFEGRAISGARHLADVLEATQPPDPPKDPQGSAPQGLVE